MPEELERGIYTFAKFAGAFLLVGVAMRRVWGLNADSAFVGGFCTALLWFVWDRTKNEGKLLKEELQELYRCLYDEAEFKRRRQMSRLTASIRNAITNKQITLGMTPEEINGVLEKKGGDPAWRPQLSVGFGDGKKEALFHEYFYRFPAPWIRLQFKRGKLAQWKMEGYQRPS